MSNPTALVRSPTSTGTVPATMPTRDKTKPFSSAFFQNAHVSVEVKTDNTKTEKNETVYIQPMVLKHIERMMRGSKVVELPEIEFAPAEYKNSCNDVVDAIGKFLKVDTQYEYYVSRNEVKVTTLELGVETTVTSVEYSPIFAPFTFHEGEKKYGTNIMEIATVIYEHISDYCESFLRIPSSVARILKELDNTRIVEFDFGRFLQIMIHHSRTVDLGYIKTELSLLDQLMVLCDVSYQSALILFPIIDYQCLYTSLESIDGLKFGARISYSTKGPSVSDDSPIAPRIFDINGKNMTRLRYVVKTRTNNGSTSSPLKVHFANSSFTSRVGLTAVDDLESLLHN